VGREGLRRGLREGGRCEKDKDGSHAGIVSKKWAESVKCN
jgi:hypothetical protein